MGIGADIASNLAVNLATGAAPSVNTFGISAFLEGQVPFYEWWDVRYNALHDGGFLIDIKGLRHGLTFPRAGVSAGPAFDVGAGFSAPTIHTYTDGAIGRGMLQPTGLFSFPATDRPHLMAYISAKSPASSTAGFRILSTAGTAMMLDRDTSTSRANASIATTGGTVQATTANNAYVVDVAHMREVYRTATHVAIAIDGVEWASTATAADFTADLGRLDTRNASTTSADRRYAVMVFANAKIPDAARAQILAYCQAAFPP